MYVTFTKLNTIDMEINRHLFLVLQVFSSALGCWTPALFVGCLKVNEQLYEMLQSKWLVFSLLVKYSPINIDLNSKVKN